MRENRSASQILFGFLPEQTVDLKGGVWKVRDWKHPIVRNEIDIGSLKREIVRQANPWRFSGMDGGFVSHMEGNAHLTVLTLNEANGVEVVPFPKLWICKYCKRVHEAAEASCPCGHTGQKGQMHFVGYHEKCGALRAPYIPKCPEHRQVKITFPGTSSATEISFDCPVCNRQLRKGFGHIRCDCGQGTLTFNVHRASSVYTPRSVVIVNPPSKERIRAITEAGGPPKALAWVLDGMKTKTVEGAQTSRESLRRQLAAQNLPLDVIEKMLDIAGTSPGVTGEGDVPLPELQRADAEAQAVTIALATLESRISLDTLISGTEPMSEMGVLYRDAYPLAFDTAGLEAVDLIEKFPVLTGQFGYTRGPHEPGTARLVPFRDRQGYRVYADIAETEALFVRLSPSKVANWLRVQGFVIPAFSDDKSARNAILQTSDLPTSLDASNRTPGMALLELVHSYAHRFLRIAAVHAGIDRNALSELLVPVHLGFFIYAAAKGDFVLGGLQAVFESDLNRLLKSVVYDEHRCALDPGCLDSGGACMACLHVGEPSCRYFNRFLNRKALFGIHGYLRSS